MELRSPSAILARLAADRVALSAAIQAARLRCATGLRHVPYSGTELFGWGGERNVPCDPKTSNVPTHQRPLKAPGDKGPRKACFLP
jgi:hypothetical protein